MTKSPGIQRRHRLWSEVELRLLTDSYADSRTDDISQVLGRSLTTVYQKARRLGLRKSSEFLASQNSGRVQFGKQCDAMKAAQFKPGHGTWNKGTKGLVGVQPACRATQFKKGRPAHEARNYLAIGSTRLTKDGLLECKVTDDPSIVPARRWVAAHRLVWIAANGPVPAGHLIAFRPGQRTTVLNEITLDRLELLSRADNARRNSPHLNWPPELARLVQLRSVLTRQINKRSKKP